ncbi:MAG: glutamate racemase, partial [Thermodesulfobacteriota bacterium]
MNTESLKEKSIGIFDSGIGGLTVAKEIIKHLPYENIVYLGDTARVPYGTKSRETVIKYAESNSRFLLSKGIKLLVVACNTASAYAIKALEAQLTIPVVGVIRPGAKKAVESTKNGRIGVIGTPSTIKSNAYPKVINKINPDITVFSKACPLFVPLAEEGWLQNDIARNVALEYLSELKKFDIDTLILGCTHYPLLKETIGEVIGKDVVLIDS